MGENLFVVFSICKLYLSMSVDVKSFNERIEFIEKGTTYELNWNSYLRKSCNCQKPSQNSLTIVSRNI